MTPTQMQNLLSEFDGRATTILTEIEARCGQQAGYVDALIGFVAAEDANLSEGATWLLKAWLDDKKLLSVSQTRSFLSAVPKVSSWQAQLHICQSIRYLSLPRSDILQIIDWLKPLLHHKRPFLRAWSLDAIVAIAQSHPNYRDLAVEALANAEQDDAASVRARARSLLKPFR